VRDAESTDAEGKAMREVIRKAKQYRRECNPERNTEKRRSNAENNAVRRGMQCGKQRNAEIKTMRCNTGSSAMQNRIRCNAESSATQCRKRSNAKAFRIIGTCRQSINCFTHPAVLFPHIVRIRLDGADARDVHHHVAVDALAQNL
jgi:hypothetical protein